jgi:hypothetical protein
VSILPVQDDETNTPIWKNKKVWVGGGIALAFLAFVFYYFLLPILHTHIIHFTFYESEPKGQWLDVREK